VAGKRGLNLSLTHVSCPSFRLCLRFQGYIGDRYSRRQALVLSILLMAVPTFIIGILPSYDSAGLWATALLVITRKFSIARELYTFRIGPTFLSYA